MWGASANLGYRTSHDLAIYFSNLPPQPANDGDRELVARGEAIYQRGVPEPTWRPVWRATVRMPRELARSLGWGLDYTYVKRRLQQWGEGYHGALRHPMPHIATLSRDEIEELASYLSFVK